METMPHPRKTQVPDQKILWILIFETVCSTGFLVPSVEKRVLLQGGYSFRSFIAV
jgi:hypothetical protein